MTQAAPIPSFLLDGPPGAPLTVALAHGAGAPMDSPFMQTMAEGLGAAGYRVARFEFPYMAERRASGKKRPPDGMAKLMATWRAVTEALGTERLVVGGKSMGGRVASMLAAEREREGMPFPGVICLGYPFHPPGKPERTRLDHLQALSTPALMVQGTRDALGSRDDVAGYTLPPAIRIHWLEDGDHSFKPRKASGRTEEQNLAEAVEACTAFLGECTDAVS